MIMSFKDAQNYKEYADSTDDLIKKCEDIVNNLTPEEANAKCNCIIQFGDRIITNKEHYQKIEYAYRGGDYTMDELVFIAHGNNGIIQVINARNQEKIIES